MERVGIKPIKQIWGDFIIQANINNEHINFDIKNKSNGKLFVAAYSIDTLPIRIKANYDTLENFLEQIRFIIEDKIVERLKIRDNGKQIVFCIPIKIGRQQNLVEQILSTQLKTPEVGQNSLVQLLQNFDAQKCKNQHNFEEIDKRVTEIGDQSLKQFATIQSLTKRIQILQNVQNQMNYLMNNPNNFQIDLHLKEWMSKMQENLQNCVQKKKQKRPRNNRMIEEAVTDMGLQDALIDEFYCKFKLKNKQFQITLIKQETAEQFKILLDEEHLSRMFYIQSAQRMFREVVFIVTNQSEKERIKISQNGFFTMKFIISIEGRDETIQEVFKPQKIDGNDIERLQNLINIRNKELLSKMKVNQIKQTQHQLRKWTQDLFKDHLQNQHKSVQLLITKMKQQILAVKHQILGISEIQKMGPQQAKTINLIALNKLILTQKDEFKGVSKQIKTLECQLSQLMKILSKLSISPQLFSNKFNVSSILSNKSDCQKLFSLLPKKVKMLNQLFKASQHNFQVSQFLKKCLGISHTVTLIKTQYGKVIGGYTPCKWTSGTWVVDTSSFLFSLTNMDKFTNSAQSIYCDPTYGPTFGSGHDIVICNQSNTSNNNYANIGNTYKNDTKYPYSQKQTWLKFSGGQTINFTTIQWQVYEVIFEQQ